MKQTKFQKDILALAKAMEQGIRKSKPCVGSYIVRNELADGSGYGKTVYACAVGAAVVDGRKFSDYANLDESAAYTLAGEALPVLFTSPDDDSSLHDHIVWLNDTDKWTRGRIVKWLRRVAKLPEPPKQWSDVK